jgi:hypothetical protein
MIFRSFSQQNQLAIAFLSVIQQFLASNSLAILSLIAIKNSQRESREGQGAHVHQSSFCPEDGSRRPWYRFRIGINVLEWMCPKFASRKLCLPWLGFENWSIRSVVSTICKMLFQLSYMVRSNRGLEIMNMVNILVYINSALTILVLCELYVVQ